MSPALTAVRGFFRLSIILTLLGAFTAVIYVFIGVRGALETLADLGYPQYLGVTRDQTFSYLINCVNDSTCFPNFMLVWRSEYPKWLLITLAALIIAIIALAVTKARMRIREYDPATGQWSTPRHLARKGYIRDPRRKDQRGYVGMLPNGKMLQLPENIRFSHTLVLGGPGAKKSTGYHWQNILMDAKDGISVIIFDLKFPDPKGGFVSALPYFEKQGYDVYAFTPYEDTTHHLPLIQDAVNEVTAREIAEMLIPPSEDGAGAFYKRSERRAITGLLMHAAACNISLTQLHTIIQQGAAEIRRFINGKGNPEYQPAVSAVTDIVSALLNADPKEQHGLLEGIAGALEFFANPQLGNATRRSPDPWLNIPLEKIAVNKSVLYVGLPQKNVDGGSGKMLLQLIKRMIDSALSQTAYDNHGAVPNPVSFYLDEFPSLGKLPNVESNFATMRSRRVAYHVTIQNISQGKAIYTDAGFKSFFTSNFQTIMLFPSFIKFDDAEYISKILGNVMTTMYGTGASRGGMHDTHSSNEREATRPLVTIDEMQTWPADEAIVILNGVPHTKVIVPGIFEEKVRGVRNPFSSIWKQLDKELDAPKYIAELTARGKRKWISNKLKASLALTRAHADAQPTPPAEAPTITVEATAAHTPTTNNEETPPPTPVVDHRHVPVDPSTLHYVSTESGKKFIPRDEINKLVDQITRANTSIRVEGDRKTRKVEALHVPHDFIATYFKPEQMTALIEEGYLSLHGHVVKVHFNKDGLLEPSRATFLLKKLPPAEEKKKPKRMSHKNALKAFNDAVFNAISQNLAAQIDYNPREQAVQRIAFNRYALLPQDNPELEHAWAYHRLVTFQGAQAYARRKGLAQLPEETTRMIVERYYAERNQAMPESTPEPAAQQQPAEATTQSKESQQPKSQANTEVRAEPNAKKRKLSRPLRPNAKTKQQGAPTAAGVTAAPSHGNSSEHTQEQPSQPTASPDAPPGQADAPAAPSLAHEANPVARDTQAQASPAQAAPPVERPPIPAATSTPTPPATPPVREQAVQGAPMKNPKPQSAVPSQPHFTWTTHPHDEPATQMMVVHDADSQNRLRQWIRLHANALVTANTLAPTRAVQGAYAPSALHYDPQEYTAEPSAPPAPDIKGDWATRTIHADKGRNVYVIDTAGLFADKSPAAHAVAEWVRSISSRTSGHPTQDSNQVPFPGVLYTPAVLTVEPKTLRGLLRLTHAIEPRYVHPPSLAQRLPFAEAVHVLVPDETPALVET